MAEREARLSVLTPADLERVRAIRHRVRLESGRSDGRCGKVAEAIEAELGWAYCWGHLRLRDGGICWIHCWNQLPDGTIVDATADQFEERGLGDVAVLSPGDLLHTHYRAAPPLPRAGVRLGRRRAPAADRPPWRMDLAGVAGGAAGAGNRLRPAQAGGFLPIPIG